MQREAPGAPPARARNRSPAAYRALFRQLPSVPPDAVRGRYEALDLGPRWYRTLFRVLLAIGGLRGWVGKEFDASGAGVNLCRRGGRVVRRSRMQVAGPIRSTLDGEPALLLRYLAPWPLRLVRDELRLHRDGTILGLTYVALRPLRRIRLPFALATTTPSHGGATFRAS